MMKFLTLTMLFLVACSNERVKGGVQACAEGIELEAQINKEAVDACIRMCLRQSSTRDKEHCVVMCSIDSVLVRELKEMARQRHAEKAFSALYPQDSIERKHYEKQLSQPLEGSAD